MVRSQSQVLAEIEEAERKLAKVQDHLAALREEAGAAPVLPDEPEAGAVIKFQVQHSVDGPVYSYVAHRFRSESVFSKTRWVIGGPQHANSYYTWEQVLDLICEDVSVKLGAKKPSFFLYESGKVVESR